jgi:hypothetical protein
VSSSVTERFFKPFKQERNTRRRKKKKKNTNLGTVARTSGDRDQKKESKTREDTHRDSSF